MKKLVVLMLMLSFVMFTGYALADTEPNDNDSNANSLEDGDSVSGTCYSGDDDWYVIELGGDDTVEVTVEGYLSTDEYVFVYSWVDGDPDGTIDLELDEFSTMESETYTNSGLGSMDLYLIVNGDGSYTLSISIEEGSLVCCCGGTMAALSVCLLGLAGMIIVLRRNR